MIRKESIAADEARREQEMQEVGRQDQLARLRQSEDWIRENLAALKARYEAGHVSRETYLTCRKDGVGRLAELIRERKALKGKSDA